MSTLGFPSQFLCPNSLFWRFPLLLLFPFPFSNLKGLWLLSWRCGYYFSVGSLEKGEVGISKDTRPQVYLQQERNGGDGGRVSWESPRLSCFFFPFSISKTNFNASENHLEFGPLPDNLVH